MRITVFAKKRSTEDGKKFYSYLAKLVKKDGEVVTTSVKFKQDCGQPRGEECPLNIEVNKTDCNFSVKQIGLDDGSIINSNELWISNWKKSDVPYVDESMEDFV